MYCFFHPVCWLDSKDPVEKSEVLEKWQSLWICAVLYGSTWNLYFYKIFIKIIFSLDNVAQGKVRTLTPWMNALSRAPNAVLGQQSRLHSQGETAGFKPCSFESPSWSPLGAYLPQLKRKRNFLTPRVKGIGEEYLMMVALTITPLDSRSVRQNW